MECKNCAILETQVETLLMQNAILKSDNKVLLTRNASLASLLRTERLSHEKAINAAIERLQGLNDHINNTQNLLDELQARWRAVLPGREVNNDA